MQRGSIWLVCLLAAAFSCGGAGRAGKGATGGAMAGHGGGGGAGAIGDTGGVAGTAGPGSGGHGTGGAGTGGATGAGGATGTGGAAGAGVGGGAAGTGGHAAHDAGADATGGTSTACAVAVDGGTAACTTQIVSDHDYDIFCALKADGRMNCWGSEQNDYFFKEPYDTTWPDAIAKAPPDLVQLSVSNGLEGQPGYLLCGVDRAGTGTCWNNQAKKTIGQGLKAITTSIFGICALDTNAAITACDANLTAPPASGVYAEILPSELYVAALDVAGVPFEPTFTGPTGTYVDLAVNDAHRVAAVRSDGAVVASSSGQAPVIQLGSFTHVAVDYQGRACAIDSSGELTCFPIESSPSPPALTPPAGPFVRIAGGESTFCAVRPTGTTACFGDVPIDVPPGW